MEAVLHIEIFTIVSIKIVSVDSHKALYAPILNERMRQKSELPEILK